MKTNKCTIIKICSQQMLFAQAPRQVPDGSCVSDEEAEIA